MGKIKVHEKALAHLSRGLYRSPASAIRELVSNAWDANATKVQISTNYPDFFEVRIQDNGDGFSRAEFEMIMQGSPNEIGGIGNSHKRTQKTRLIHDRPVIGRLGIGMLGIATFCPSFTITSKTRDGNGFSARIRLYDLLKQKLDLDDAEFVSAKEIDVGEYEIEKSFNPKNAEFGTLIKADDVHPTFISSFQRDINQEGFKEPSLDWTDNIETCSRVRSVNELGEYWKLLWELSAACPLPYCNEEALPDNLISVDHKRLQEFDFHVVVDSIPLAKPVRLIESDVQYTCCPLDDISLQPYGKRLRFHGYFVVQEGRQIKPDNLRGLLIRIKDIAIGYYDYSLLGYPYNEGPRTRWITGEVFVDEGLEDALNLDRESFNRFHPEFRELQEYVHKFLQKQVFTRSYKQIAKRSKRREAERKMQHADSLSAIVAEHTKTDITFCEHATDADEREASQVIVSQRANHLEVTVPRPDILNTKKANKDIASAILVIYEVSLLEKSSAGRKEAFRRLLPRPLVQMVKSGGFRD